MYQEYKSTGDVGYKPHPIAELFPMMLGDEFISLKADIKEKGLLVPVLIYEGMILDGRNRFKACQEVGREIIFNEYVGDDPIGHVLSLNKERRHLTSSQLACVAVDLLPLEAAEAKKRQVAAGVKTANNSVRNDSGQIIKVVQLIEQPCVSDSQTINSQAYKSIEKPKEQNSNKAIESAAKKVGTNRQYVADAKKLKEEKPELYTKVTSGEMSITQAKREVKEEKREAVRQENREKISVAEPVTDITDIDIKFSTIVIDPPWDWGDEGDKDQLGRARPDYQTLSIDQLLELPLEDLSLPDAHIYLWITNRSLPKGFQLLDKWGFRYITCITWVKPHFGMGNYFRGQTEQILFGVKGSLPLKRKDVGTVFSADRGKDGHSSKPLEFYKLVESCSHSPYLEMFSRNKSDGWVSWGENGLTK